MNRTEFIVVASIILMVAFLLGWFMHWLLSRFARIKGANMNEMDKLAQLLHDAEETRDQAILVMEERERELLNQITQTQAELHAAMEGLRQSRHEIEEMRVYIERNSAR